MPSRSNFWIKLTGTLDGQMTDSELATVQQLFWGVFPQQPPKVPGTTGAWVERFRFPDWPENYTWPVYNVCIWDSSIELVPFSTLHDGRPLTLLNFHAQLAHMRPGNLYQNYEDMKWEIEWFYSYCRQAWYLQMMREVDQLNAQLASSGRLRDRIDVRDWCWDCGNGGGE
jgi:hypothetical protein